LDAPCCLLKARLIAIAVSIVVLAMLAVAIANFHATRSSTLAALDTQMLQLSHSHTPSPNGCVLKQAVVARSQGRHGGRSLPAQGRAGSTFDMAHIGFADKHAVFSQERQRAPTTIPQRGPGTSRRPRWRSLSSRRRISAPARASWW
jgi:methyl-accepting chemotaxis protein